MKGTAPFRFAVGLAAGAAAAALALLAARPCVAVDAPPGFVVENAFPGVTFYAPMQVVFLPDGRKLVAQLDGVVWILTAAGAKLATPFIDLHEKVLEGNGRGLMSVAIDPDFSSNRWVYFTYSADPDSNGADVESEAFARLERYQAAAGNPDVADLGTRQILIGGSWSDGIPMLDTFHTVGSIQFARDKSLLLASGDAAHFDATDAGGIDPNGFGPGKTDPSQDIGSFRSLSLDSYCGKILRVDKETGRGLPSNPYWNGDPDAVRSKVWLYGLRNPFRFGVRPGSGSTDPSDGDAGSLYVGDVGWFTYEELHIARQPGLNLGWPCVEGPSPQASYQAVTATAAGNTNVLCSSPLNPENPAPPTGPQLWWHHTDASFSNPPGTKGRTVLGGPFAGGPSYPAPYAGSFYVGEYTLSWIKAVQVDANDNVVGVTDFLTNADHPNDLEVDPVSGDLFYTAIFAGEVRRVRYVPAPPDTEVVEARPAPEACVSTAHPCITVPVVLERTNSTPIRAYNVTLELGSELSLCGPGIVAGTYLSGVSPSQFQVVDHGGGSYTVSEALLGLPCGAQGTGTLFTLSLTSVSSPIPGSITVTAATAEDCGGGSVPVAPGAPALVPNDRSLPAAIADLAATQVTAGNDADGTIRLRLTFTPAPDAASVEVYRAPFGNYPEYDDAPAAGSTPTAPAYPPPAPWTLTGVTASGQTDEVATRDVWTYVAFSRDGCGNVSAASIPSAAIPNYVLGDVTNGFAPCAGNNAVTTADLSLLGAHYGITLAPADPLACMDVGPTEDFSVHARPLTDDRVDFEDLVIFAINWSGAPAAMVAVTPPGADDRGGAERVWVETPASVAPGAALTVPLRMHGEGRVQALSVRLSWDPSVVEPSTAEAGSLLPPLESLALSPAPGAVDVALLGARSRGIVGEGEVARLAFRILKSGDPRIEVASVVARDARNHPVATAIAAASGSARPDQVALRPALPNPFARQTTLEFTLPAHASVELDVYSVDGRRVRRLLSGPYDAGAYAIPWDGRDDHGRDVSTGVFFARLRAGSVTRTRTLTCLR